MKTSSLAAATATAFLTASSAMAQTEQPPQPRYEILDYTGFENFYMNDPEQSIEAYQAALASNPLSFHSGAFTFYYAHIKDLKTGDDILCSGALIIAPTAEAKDLYPEISNTTLYTTSPTIQKLLIAGDHIDENITQYGSCMVVNGDDLRNKDNYILQPGRANGLHLPFPQNEQNDFTYDIQDAYKGDLWESEGWIRQMDEAGSALESGNITAEQAGEVADTVLNNYLNAMQTYLDTHAYGTHKNTLSCDTAGFNAEIINDIGDRRHYGSDLPLCGRLSFDSAPVSPQ